MPRRPRHRPRPRSLVADALAGLTALTALAVACVAVVNLEAKGPADTPGSVPSWLAANTGAVEPPSSPAGAQIAARAAPPVSTNDEGWVEAAGRVSLLAPMPITSEVTLAALADPLTGSATMAEDGHKAIERTTPLPIDIAAVAGAPVPFPIRMQSATSSDSDATASNGAIELRTPLPGGSGPRPRPTELALLETPAAPLGPRHRPSP